MKIYEKIFERLEELNMSQIELSGRTGIATSTISDWRKKQINPQADKLVPICKALEMSIIADNKMMYPDYEKNMVARQKMVGIVMIQDLGFLFMMNQEK